MADEDDESIVMDVEEIEDGEIKEAEVYVILDETDGEESEDDTEELSLSEEPEPVDSYGRVKRPNTGASSSRIDIAKKITLGSLLSIDRTKVGSRRKKPDINDEKSCELGDRNRDRLNNKVWGSQVFNKRDRDGSNSTPPTAGRPRNDIWGTRTRRPRPRSSITRPSSSIGFTLIGRGRQEDIQRKRKAERITKRRSRSKEFDILLRDYREVQRAIRVEEARQNGSSTHRASSVRRTLPRRHSRLSSVVNIVPKSRSRSKTSINNVDPAKDKKGKQREDDDDEMTELELRRLALVSAKRGFESKKDPSEQLSDALNLDGVLSKQSLEQDNYEEVAMDVEDDIMGANKMEGSSLLKRLGSSIQAGSPSKEEEEDDEEFEELALRAALLKNMASKKNVIVPNQSQQKEEVAYASSPKSQEVERVMQAEVPKVPSGGSSPYHERSYTYKPTKITRKPVIPMHGPLVITFNADSSDEEPEETEEPVSDAYTEMMQFIKQARNSSQQPKDTSKESTKEESTKDKTKVRVISKTPDAVNKLPETHVAEYRRLKEEIARRENLKGSTTTSSSKLTDVQAKRVAALAAKLNRNRSLMEKNYHMYQESARHQSEKQRNMQKALFKIQKLKEQIAVMEKVAVLHKNLVKKYSDEQKSRLSSLERSVSVEVKVREELRTLKESEVGECPLVAVIQQLKDEQTVLAKREVQLDSQEKIKNYGNSKMSKATRNRASELHRLKKLEEEFALKIKLYREVQAKATTKPTESNTQNGKRKLVEGGPRPAVSIYQKDKIQFSFNNTPTQTDSETEKENIDKDGDAGRKKRRRSWLDDNSSLTPQLAVKEKKITQMPTFVGKIDFNVVGTLSPGGLAVENDLVRLPERVPRGDYLHPSNYFTSELLSGKRKRRRLLTGHSEVESEAEYRNIKLERYLSPLMCFRAYRLHEAHWRATGLSPLSKSFSNKLDPRRVLCKFELNGVCNDSTCKCLHERDYLLSDEAILADILSYAPSLVNITPEMGPEEQSRKIGRFLQSLTEQVKKETSSSQTKDKGNFCLKSVFRQLRKEKAELPVLCERQWKPNNEGDMKQRTTKHVEEEDADMFQIFRAKRVPEAIHILGIEDNRYYCGGEQSIETLESLVLEESKQIELWLKLVTLILKDRSPKNQDRALNALSRGLEHNPSSPELWHLYLSLYSRRPEHPDLLEICSQAIHHTKDYSVHWKCLEVSATFQSKLSNCQDILQLLTSDVSKKKDELTSHQIFEILLYQTQVHILAGRVRDACQFIKGILSSNGILSTKGTLSSMDALDTLSFKDKLSAKDAPSSMDTLSFKDKLSAKDAPSSMDTPSSNDNLLTKDTLSSKDTLLSKDTPSPKTDESTYLSFLTQPDTSLLWITYIHLESFHSLPPCLFEETGCGLSRVIKKSHFICPWHQPICRSVDEILVFFDASCQLGKDDQFCTWSMLYHNWIALLSSSDRKQEAVNLCRQILDRYPEERSVWKTLLVIEMKRSEDIIKVREIYYEAFSRCPPSPELYYTAAKLENIEGFPAEAITILSDCAAAFFDLPEEGASYEDTANLFRILLHQPVEISFKSPPMQNRLRPIVEDSQAYIWLCFCFLLTLRPSSSGQGIDPKDAFELAISSLPTGDGVLDICLQYFQYQLWRSGPTPDERGKTLRRLVKSVIKTRPSSFLFPFDETHFYTDYSFHNTLIDVYLSYLQPKYLTEAYEDYISLMPQNLGLLQKFLDYLWQDDAFHYIQFMAKSALATHPKCLFLWNVLLQATEKTGNLKEVASLSTEAVRALPMVALLWRHHSQKVDLCGVLENGTVVK